MTQTIDSIITRAIETPADRYLLAHALRLVADAHARAAQQLIDHPKAEAIARTMSKSALDYANSSMRKPPNDFRMRMIVFNEACRVLHISHADKIAIAEQDDQARQSKHLLTGQ